MTLIAGQDQQVVVVLLADIAQEFRLWGWSLIAKGSKPFQAIRGLRFLKVLGSGHEGGFSLRPSGSRQGLFAVFDNAHHADDFLAHAEIMKSYFARANEICLVKMQTWSCKGAWDGTSLLITSPTPSTGPVAALTRGSIRINKAAAFWRHAPATQTALENADGCQLAVGLGEAPFLRQATFTLWDSVAAMDAYARTGAHLKAIGAATQHGYFSESMFARFTPQVIKGRWKDRLYG